VASVEGNGGAAALEAPGLPAGARDVLPVEAAELRAIEAALTATFAAYGYREVMTPALELAGVMDRAQEGGLGRAFRLFDDQGRVLVLRPDLTIPIARLVASRLGDHPGPVRVSYVARAFRPPPAGRPDAAEQLQAGVELVGLAGPAADAELIGLLVEALRRAGLAGLRVGVGDVSLTQAVLDALEVRPAARARLGEAAAARNLVAWRRVTRDLGLAPPAAALVGELPSLRGGAAVLERVAAAAPAAGEACARLERMLALVDAHGAGAEVMLDLGVQRDWGYYSGIVLEAYAPGVGSPVAMGGRYDGLAARFGKPRPAVGFAISLDLLHRALAAGAAGADALRTGVVLVGGLDEELAAAQAVRARGLPVIALPAGDLTAEGLAGAEGWRYVARREGTGFSLLDRERGERVDSPTLGEALSSRG
jgi:ATP phosphoribosyltransferase regulatory subunit